MTILVVEMDLTQHDSKVQMQPASNELNKSLPEIAKPLNPTAKTRNEIATPLL